MKNFILHLAIEAAEAGVGLNRLIGAKLAHQ
jgi:hypothetical protein